MTDKYDERAKELLPCLWKITHNMRDCLPGDEAPCAICTLLPSVAAARREKDAEIERLKTQLKAEAERVTERDCGILDHFLIRGTALLLIREIRAAQAKEREG